MYHITLFDYLVPCEISLSLLEKFILTIRYRNLFFLRRIFFFKFFRGSTFSLRNNRRWQGRPETFLPKGGGGGGNFGMMVKKTSCFLTHFMVAI